MNAEIHINFISPGDWSRFRMTSIWYDEAGFQHRARCLPGDIPPEYAPALTEAVGALVALGEPWQARHVIARHGIMEVQPEPMEDMPEMEIREYVALEVEAVNAAGARRVFTLHDYPELLLLTPEASAFFNYFTHANNHE